jgi:hypothetical protein
MDEGGCLRRVEGGESSAQRAEGKEWRIAKMRQTTIFHVEAPRSRRTEAEKKAVRGTARPTPEPYGH